MTGYPELRDVLQSIEEKQAGGGASEAGIAEAEIVLGVRFPPSFRWFLRDFGWINVGAWEIFGLGEDVPSWLALVPITISERSEVRTHLPNHLLPFSNDGAGNLYCLNTARIGEKEATIVLWDHDLPETQTPAFSAVTFPDWLVERLNEYSVMVRADQYIPLLHELREVLLKYDYLEEANAVTELTEAARLRPQEFMRLLQMGPIWGSSGSLEDLQLLGNIGGPEEPLLRDTVVYQSLLLKIAEKMEAEGIGARSSRGAVRRFQRSIDWAKERLSSIAEERLAKRHGSQGDR